MKSFFVSTILVLTFCVGAFAQTSETSPCPTINLTGPWEVTKLDEPIIFRAEVSQEVHNFNAKYNWSVSSGEIIEGQGTLTIKVLRKELGKYITAALEVTGLPKECVNSASETEPTCSCPDFRKIDEFSISASRIDKARLDNLLIELQNNPLAVAYIFERFERKTSQNAVNRKIQEITDYLIKEKRIEKDRFVISTAVFDKNLTQYFIVPPGATPPEIEDYN
jgi:hypothetical protein